MVSNCRDVRRNSLTLSLIKGKSRCFMCKSGQAVDTLHFTMVTYGLSFFFDSEVSFVSFYDFFYIDLLFTI